MSKQIRLMVLCAISILAMAQMLCAQTNVEAVMLKAINTAFANVQKDQRIAILQITASRELSEFMLGEIQHILVSRGYTVLERTEMDRIREEQHLGITGEVDDNTAARIGQFLGADVIVTGAVTGSGELRRLRLKCLKTETAVIIGSASEPFPQPPPPPPPPPAPAQARPATTYTPPPPPPPPAPQKKQSTTHTALVWGMSMTTFDGDELPLNNVKTKTDLMNFGLSIVVHNPVIVIEPGVRWIQKGAEFDTTVVAGEPITDMYTLGYLELLMKLKLNIRKTIYPYAGFAAGLLLDAKQDSNEKKETAPGIKKENTIDKFEEFEFSIPLGVDVRITDWFVIGFEYNIGLTNLFKDYSPKENAKSNMMLFTAGFFF